ncbi:MAG: hypothetical protein IT233_07355 [Bacteroidia bacterium]|nr:hypothetical protein [Bacteroidia bacterium]
MAITLMTLTTVFNLRGQVVTFQKTFGTPGYDHGRAFITRDSGYILIGAINMFSPSEEGCIIRLSRFGDTLWKKIYRHPLYTTGCARHIVEFSNGDLFFNLTVTSGPNPGYIGIRANAQGDTLQTFICPGGESFYETPDGGLVFFGSSFAAKYSASMTLQWIKHFGHPSEYYDGKGIITSDGGYFLLATTRFYAAGGPSDFDWLCVKLDSAGSVQWQKVIGTTFFENCGTPEQSSDGGFIMTGSTVVNGGPSNPDVLVVKLDPSGNLVWAKTYGGPNEEEPSRIYKTFGSPGYIISGVTMGNELTFNSRRGFMYKIDLAGNFMWGKIYGHMNPSMGGRDEIHHAYPTYDGGFLLSGQSQNLGQNQDFDFWIIKTDPNGNSGCHEMNTIPQVLTPPIVVQTITPVDTPSVWNITSKSNAPRVKTECASSVLLTNFIFISIAHP